MTAASGILLTSDNVISTVSSEHGNYCSIHECIWLDVYLIWIWKASWKLHTWSLHAECAGWNRLGLTICRKQLIHIPLTWGLLLWSPDSISKSGKAELVCIVKMLLWILRLKDEIDFEQEWQNKLGST